jgi:hypothetical protein
VPTEAAYDAHTMKGQDDAVEGMDGAPDVLGATAGQADHLPR